MTDDSYEDSLETSIGRDVGLFRLRRVVAARAPRGSGLPRYLNLAFGIAGPRQLGHPCSHELWSMKFVQHVS